MSKSSFNEVRSDIDVRARRLAAVRAYGRQLMDDLLRMQRGLGVEAIHDVRVDARRLRVVLRVLQTECQPILLQTLLFDLRDIGRALALVREADVRRQQLAPLLNRERRINPSAVEAAARLRLDCRQERQDLKSLIQSKNWQVRLRKLHDSVACEALLAWPRPERCFDLEHAALNSQLRNIRKDIKSGCSIKRKQLHALRIKVKKARYLCDWINELAAPVPRGLSENLKHLQTRLGELHDALQLQQWLDKTTEFDRALCIQLHQALRLSVTAHYRELPVWCRDKFSLDF